MKKKHSLPDKDYVALAEFRHALRKFLAFSEVQAASVGLTPQQHQALLAIRGAAAETATVGYVAEQLIMKPHSATGLIDRLETQKLVSRHVSDVDRRRAVLQLTRKAERQLASLSATHREEIRRLRPLLVTLLERFG